MVAVTETSLLLQTKPTTTGAKIGAGDWKLHVERLAADEAGAVWDLDLWDSDATTPGLAIFPGVAGNYLSVPDTAAFDIVGDLTIVVRALAVDWTLSSQAFKSKWGAAGQRSYKLIVQASGVLRLEWSANGTASITADSTVAVGLTDATWKWLAANLDVDNGAAGYSVRFWLSDDGITWTQLGTTVTVGGVTSIFASTAPLEVGSSTGGTADLFVGWIDNVQVFAGIDTVTVNQAVPGGVLRFQIYDADWAASPFTTASGHTATLNTSGGTPASIVAAAGITNTVWASLGWESLNDVLRGMEWSRGADQPNGRPRNGEIALTLLNEMDGLNDPWVNYNNVRPGTVLRAGIASATDTRADGWVPLWTGIVESWTPQYVGARSSGYRADSFAEVRLIETLGWVARTDAHALGAPAGAGETIVPRVDRLLVDVDWPFGVVTLFDPDNPLLFTLQATSMTANRLTELYLTADSTGGIVRSDVTGACLIANKETDSSPSRLAEFTFFDFFGIILPMFVLADKDLVDGDLWQFGYDPDSIQTVNDPEGIVNDHRYTRVGGTQQIFEHPVSIGQFGRITRARGDLICQTDPQALAIANDDNDHEALTALRIDNIEVVATGRPNALLAAAAADHNDTVWVFPPAAVGFTGSATGHIRSLSHTITPMKGRIHWTVNYAIDLNNFNNLPGAMLPPA